MNDILPAESPNWRYLEEQFINCVSSYGYQEIRMPLVENTQLFKRSIGEVTDIVEKEMYTFTDLNGDSLTLRPEGTAGCVRACLEHGLLHNQTQKLWYMGAMFRHERPQKGRYRQFYQFGVEAFGYPGATIEVELIALSLRLWKQLGIESSVKLQINSLGELEERQQYKELLVNYLSEHFDALDEDSKRRLHRNPLRVLDSKNPAMQTLIANAPKLIDHLGERSRLHFEQVCQKLEALEIEYIINPFLVRGLDYYSQTVFEWVTDKLGSQATICAGGRYDALLAQLGSTASAAVGFAMGAERLLLLMESLNIQAKLENPLCLFIIAEGDRPLEQALIMAESLRDSITGCKVLFHPAGGSFKSQFKKADKSEARLALIIGEDEIVNHQVGIKDLRHNQPQISIDRKDLVTYLQAWQTGENN